MVKGQMTAGELASFLMYSTYVGFNMAGVGSVYGELMKASGAASRIFEVIDEKPSIPSSLNYAKVSVSK